MELEKNIEDYPKSNIFRRNRNNIRTNEEKSM